MSNLVGVTLLNRYHVESFVGRGGMAEVYRVWDAQRATYLAMKLLREDLAQDRVFLRRFRREAETLARLQHPHTVRFYGLEQDGLAAFMLMDYIEGTSLRTEIFQSEGTPLPRQRIREVMRPICSALYYAHSQGMIHCDVKPGNILIDQTGRVLVSDFGIARMTDGATATMVGVGTPAYMAPEQVLGQAPVPQTDIYALGVVLYEMLTGGERPFTGERAKTTGSTSEKVRWEQLKLRPPSPRKYNSDISPELEAVVLGCLSKAAEQRYQAPLDLLNALERAMGAKSTAAPILVARPAPRVESCAADDTHDPMSPHMASRTRIWGGVMENVERFWNDLFDKFALSQAPEPVELRRKPKPRTNAWDGVVESIERLWNDLCNKAALSQTPEPVELRRKPKPQTDTWGNLVKSISQFRDSLLGSTALLATVCGALMLCLCGVLGSILMLSMQSRQLTHVTATSSPISLPTSTPKLPPTSTTTLPPIITPSEQVSALTGTAEFYSNLAAQAVSGTRLAGPYSGTLYHNSNNNVIETYIAAATTADFAAYVTFAVPYASSTGLWDFGFLFRENGWNNQYRLVIESTGVWELQNVVAGKFTWIASGSIPCLQTSGGQTNSILLIASGDDGCFYVNDRFVTKLDLSARSKAGSVTIGIGLWNQHEVDGQKTTFSNFTIWELP